MSCWRSAAGVIPPSLWPSACRGAAWRLAPGVMLVAGTFPGSTGLDYGRVILPGFQARLLMRSVMKTSMKMLLAAGILCGTGLVATAPVAAQPVGFSFRIGDVAMAYDDGYYDRRHRWHAWRHARERNWYRAKNRDSYRGMRHDRDHDGIPNRFDRDRDNDGVPNRYDRRPNIPYRNYLASCFS